MLEGSFPHKCEGDTREFCHRTQKCRDIFECDEAAEEEETEGRMSRSPLSPSDRVRAGCRSGGGVGGGGSSPPPPPPARAGGGGRRGGGGGRGWGQEAHFQSPNVLVILGSVS